MGKILRIVAGLILLVSFAFGQSVEHNKLFFRETFDDEFSVRRNSGTLNAVTFSNGVGIFSETNNNINYPKLGGSTFSVRIRFKPIASSSGEMIIDFRGASGGVGYILTSVSPDRISPTSGTEYVNGVATSIMTIGVFNEICVTGMTVTALGNMFIGTNYVLGADLTAEIDFIEIYNYTLSAEEVANLYEGKRFPNLTGQNEILNVSAQSGTIIDKWGATLTNTATTVVKNGEVNAMLFDGSTSKVDCGVPDALIGDMTVIAWAKLYGKGQNNGGRMFDNGKFWIRQTGNSLSYYSASSNAGGGNANGNTVSNDFEYNEWHQLVVTRTSAGVTNMYINGQQTGNADQSSGTPVTGSTNLIIGSDNVGTYNFDGLINDARIIDGILTAPEISQLYTSEKYKYAQ